MVPEKEELENISTVSAKIIGAKSKTMLQISSLPSPLSSSIKSSSSSTFCKQQQQRRAILSRRQRKNRTRAPREQHRELRERDEDHEDDYNGPPPLSNLNPSRHHRGETSKNTKDTVTYRQAEQQKKASNKAGINEPKKNSNTESSNNKITIGLDSKKSKSLLISSMVTKPSHLNNLSDAALALLLRRYTLTGDQLAHFGYPVEFSNLPGYVIIINYQQHPMNLRTHHRHYNQYQYQHLHQHQHHLDVNAREFVPNSWANGYWNSNWNTWLSTDADSGNGSASSSSSSSSSLENSDQEQESASDSDKASDAGETSPPESEAVTSSVLSPPPGFCQIKTKLAIPKYIDRSHTIERRCARCFRSFLVNRETGEYLAKDQCSYHWGKLRSPIDGSPHTANIWECCGSRESSRGCSVVKAHVWTGIVPGYNGPYHDYVRTRPARQVARDGNYGVYGLDCEMCFTKRGLELGKVTVVSVDGQVIYEALVKPDTEIIDYNTRFSGLRVKDFVKANKRLRDVQKDITSFVFAETILIGHGLENDLRALRILHPTVIDTCVAFPHFLGYPYRSSLKTLARTVLRKEIQVKEHDSTEDARIAVDLILKRLQHDFF